jgi:hypothetical protein
MKTHHKIVIGDSRKMTELPDNSVDLIIRLTTSENA